MDTIDETRIERDSMGEMRVPANAYYGASTQRAVLNFPISDLRFPRQFIRALGQIKLAAAEVNETLGTVDPSIAEAIVRAAQEVIDGKLDSHFVLDIFQTGSGTSTNMNANEVIANRAGELLGGSRGSRKVHANEALRACVMPRSNCQRLLSAALPLVQASIPTRTFRPRSASVSQS